MYGLRGLGLFDAPSRADFGLDPNGGGMHCDARDGVCVVRQNDGSNAYVRAVDIEQASNNYDQCELNAQNANSQAQFDEVMARCRQQAAIQAAPDVPTTTYYTPGMPLSYSPGGPAIPAPTYTVPSWAVTQPAFTHPISLAPPVPVSNGGGAATPPASTPSPAPGVTLQARVTPPTSTGFDFSAIPVWGWAAAAGLALFAFGGNSRG